MTKTYTVILLYDKFNAYIDTPRQYTSGYVQN